MFIDRVSMRPKNFKKKYWTQKKSQQDFLELYYILYNPTSQVQSTSCQLVFTTFALPLVDFSKNFTQKWGIWLTPSKRSTTPPTSIFGLCLLLHDKLGKQQTRDWPITVSINVTRFNLRRVKQQKIYNILRSCV